MFSIDILSNLTSTYYPCKIYKQDTTDVLPCTVMDMSINFESNIPTYVVDSNLFISDNIHKLPLILSTTVMARESQLEQLLSQIHAIQFSNDYFVVKGRNETIYTNLKYNTIEVPQSIDMTDMYQIAIEFKEVLKTTALSAVYVSPKASADVSRPVNKGTQAPKKVEPPKKTLGKQGLDLLRKSPIEFLEKGLDLIL